MKFFKTLNLYKNSVSSNIIDLNNLKATSYDWWQYLAVIKGKIVFNDYNYSSATNKHQAECRSLLSKNGIQVDLFIKTEHSLTDERAVQNAIDLLNREIRVLKAEINKPRSQKKKNLERIFTIEKLETEITILTNELVA